MPANTNIFNLPATITIRNAADVLQTLQDDTDKDSVLLCAAGVEEITSPGLQLLAACWQHAKKHHLDFQITEPSPALKEALSCAGLTYLLD